MKGRKAFLTTIGAAAISLASCTPRENVNPVLTKEEEAITCFIQNEDELPRIPLDKIDGVMQCTLDTYQAFLIENGIIEPPNVAIVTSKQCFEPTTLTQNDCMDQKPDIEPCKIAKYLVEANVMGDQYALDAFTEERHNPDIGYIPGCWAGPDSWIDPEPDDTELFWGEAIVEDQICVVGVRFKLEKATYPSVIGGMHVEGGAFYIQAAYEICSKK